MRIFVAWQESLWWWLPQKTTFLNCLSTEGCLSVLRTDYGLTLMSLWLMYCALDTGTTELTNSYYLLFWLIDCLLLLSHCSSFILSSYFSTVQYSVTSWRTSFRVSLIRLASSDHWPQLMDSTWSLVWTLWRRNAPSFHWRPGTKSVFNSTHFPSFIQVVLTMENFIVPETKGLAKPVLVNG